MPIWPKYFIGYKDTKKLNLYAYFFEEWDYTKKTLMKLEYISFLIKDDELLKEYNEIWEKVKNNLKKEFDSEPVYNEKYLKAKIKLCNGKISINFHDNKIPKEGSQHMFFSNFDQFYF